jgi:serine protease Do
MGATIQNVTPEIADSLGISGKKGALIAEIVPGGPASKAGLQPGDVVLELNGQAVSSNSELTRLVAQVRTGDIMHLKILRNGQTRNIDIKSGVRPSEADLNKSANDNSDEGDENNTPTKPEAARPSALGMTFSPLDEATRRRYSIPAEVRGVVIESVTATSDAGKKGVRRGDVIIRAGDRVAAAPADVIAAVDAAKSEKRPSVLLQVFHGGRNTFVPIKIEP